MSNNIFLNTANKYEVKISLEAKNKHTLKKLNFIRAQNSFTNHKRVSFKKVLEQDG